MSKVIIIKIKRVPPLIRILFYNRRVNFYRILFSSIIIPRWQRSPVCYYVFYFYNILYYLYRIIIMRATFSMLYECTQDFEYGPNQTNKKIYIMFIIGLFAQKRLIIIYKCILIYLYKSPCNADSLAIIFLFFFKYSNQLSHSVNMYEK